MFDIENWLSKRGYTRKDRDVRTFISLWLAWYKGYVSDFHSYRYYNGMQYLKAKRKSLAMAKFVCEDWANLLMNERVSISVDEGYQERLDQLLNDQHWRFKANQLVEIAFALGTGAFVEYSTGDGQTEIDCYRADMIFPISWTAKGVTECAFASVCTINGVKAVYVMLHLLDNGKYIIENHWFDYDKGAELDAPEGTIPVVQTGSSIPLFQLITPNIVNGVDMDSPMGMSVYGYSMDVLASLDDCYDSLDNEFRLGRKRVMLPMSMAKIQMMGETDSNGNPVMRPAFDHNDAVFYAYETDPNNPVNTPIELNMSLRVDEHKAALLAHLSLLGKKVGTGSDRYTWDKGSGVKTATEVISDKSDLYQNMRKHEMLLQDAITGMVKALAFLDGVELDEIRITFDDSIIQDSQSELDNAIAKKTNGLISAHTIMTEVFGMTEDEAEEEMQRIAEEDKVTMPQIDMINAGTDQPMDDDDQDEQEQDEEEAEA